VFIPILFGPLGIVLGIVGYRKGDRSLGRVAIIVSALGLILGIVLTIGALTLLQTQELWRAQRRSPSLG
jgi:sulfite exporter TauE/SafE